MTGLSRNKWLWLFGTGLLLSGAVGIIIAGYVGLLADSAVASGAPVFPVLLDIALPVLGGLAVVVALLALSGVGLLWVIVRSASLPRSDRIGALAKRAEREYPPLRALGLADLFTPPEPSADEQAEQALAELKRQYVDGEITEAEFERKVGRLVANDSIDEVHAARERNRLRDDGLGRDRGR